jgi:fructokinase
LKDASVVMSPAIPPDAVFGAVEAGGTKIVCAVGSGPRDRILSRTEFPTADDAERCLADVADWLIKQQRRHGRLEAIGVAAFGPIDLAEHSPTYGYITSTPKRGWANVDVLGPVRREFPSIPLVLDTDVNGAALGEHAWGAARGLTDFVYVTLGTGIGGGGMARGNLLHGLVHPEMGHMRLPRLAGDDFPGICPYHGDCWEGLCSGPAIEARTGVAASDLPSDHPAWRITAHYVAVALANIVCIVSPQRVIIGGGVRKGGRLGNQAFFDMVRKGLQKTLNAYVASPVFQADGIREYVVAPQLGDDAGVCGAMALARRAL